jgi:hypothetical protein
LHLRPTKIHPPLVSSLLLALSFNNCKCTIIYEEALLKLLLKALDILFHLFYFNVTGIKSAKAIAAAVATVATKAEGNTAKSYPPRLLQSTEDVVRRAVTI